ncbi:MAG: hypothetical protein ABIZ04_14320 [Opitutus sp.]
MTLSPALPSWTAEPVPHPPIKDDRLSPLAVDKHWQSLVQSWRSDGTETGFNPGWARIEWSPTALIYDIVMLGSQPKNRATTLNEHTWELGDVAEIFLQATGQSRYIELHVTPENQRLQLMWPVGGLEQVRSGHARFEEFTIASADWVQSSTHIGPGFWVAHAVVPLSVLGLEPGSNLPALKTAVCRYDCSRPPLPILSSTAPLHAPDYHRFNEWQTLELVDARS